MARYGSAPRISLALWAKAPVASTVCIAPNMLKRYPVVYRFDLAVCGQCLGVSDRFTLVQLGGFEQSGACSRCARCFAPGVSFPISFPADCLLYGKVGRSG